MNLFFTIVLALQSKAWGAEKLSWQACVDEATRNNSELKSAYQNWQSSQFSSRGSYSSFLPKLGGSISYDYGHADPSKDPAESSYAASLTANQILFDGFLQKAKIDKASAQEKVQEIALVVTKAKLSAELTMAYSDLLFAQRSVELQEKIVHRREENLRLVDLRFQGGSENRGSVLLSQAYLNQAHFEALQAKNNVEINRAQLARVLGRDDDTSTAFIVTDEVPLEVPSTSLDFHQLVQSTPEHLQSLAQTDAARAEVSSARSYFFPTLELNASTGRTGQDWFPENKRWSVGASLNFPLFDGGRDYYATKSAIATLVATSTTNENSDRASLTKLKQAYSSYIEAREKFKVDQSFQVAALKRAEIARSKYNNGLLTFENWDLIENDLISRDKTVLQSQREQTTAEATWMQVQGKGVIP